MSYANGHNGMLLFTVIWEGIKHTNGLNIGYFCPSETMGSNMNSINSAFRSIRETKKLSRGYVSEATGIAVSTIKRFESGSPIGSDRLERLCNAIGMELVICWREKD